MPVSLNQLYCISPSMSESTAFIIAQSAQSSSPRFIITASTTCDAAADASKLLLLAKSISSNKAACFSVRVSFFSQFLKLLYFLLCFETHRYKDLSPPRSEGTALQWPCFTLNDFNCHELDEVWSRIGLSSVCRKTIITPCTLPFRSCPATTGPFYPRQN